MNWTWEQLEAAELVGKKFQTWSPIRPQKKSFKVQSINAHKIVFVPKKSVEPRPLPKSKSEVFLEKWDAYKSGKIKNEEHPTNLNTSYLPGLLWALETNPSNSENR